MARITRISANVAAAGMALANSGGSIKMTASSGAGV